MSEPRTEKVYTRIGKALDRAFRIRAAERGLKPPDALEDAIRNWTEAERVTPPQSQSQTTTNTQSGSTLPQKNQEDSDNQPGELRVESLKSPRRDKVDSWVEHREEHAALEYILSQGPPGIARAIAENVHWFHVAAKVANGHADPGELSPRTGGRSIEERVERARQIQQEHRGGGGDSRKLKDRASGQAKKSG